jgi:hypothetical protein
MEVAEGEWVVRSYREDELDSCCVPVVEFGVRGSNQA